MTWQVMDIRDMAAFQDGSFNVVLDKGAKRGGRIDGDRVARA